MARSKLSGSSSICDTYCCLFVSSFPFETSGMDIDHGIMALINAVVKLLPQIWDG